MASSRAPRVFVQTLTRMCGSAPQCRRRAFLPELESSAGAAGRPTVLGTPGPTRAEAALGPHTSWKRSTAGRVGPPECPGTFENDGESRERYLETTYSFSAS